MKYTNENLHTNFPDNASSYRQTTSLINQGCMNMWIEKV